VSMWVALVIALSAFVSPCGSFSSTARRVSQAASVSHASRRSDISSVLVPSPFSLPANAARFGDADVDFTTSLVDFGLGLRSNGRVRIEAPVATVWDLVTDYERHPEFIPNILSTRVERNGGQTVLNQAGLLSRKLNLRADMRLAVTELPLRQLKLQRVSGHGFMDFKATYTFAPAGDHCVLQYEVQAVPCPIFPMPLVQQKVRKEVPRMLSALRAAAIERRVHPDGSSAL